MTNPVLMVIDEEPSGLSTLASALRRRYERDYVIVEVTSPAAAMFPRLESRSRCVPSTSGAPSTGSSWSIGTSSTTSSFSSDGRDPCLRPRKHGEHDVTTFGQVFRAASVLSLK